MRAKLIKIVQDLRASYWFVPSLMALSALLLSIFMEWLDANYGATWLREFDWLTATHPEGARSVLTVIAGSIIGVAGVTFSITIVAVSYASANFGPRLIGNFMRDRGNQLTLGTFIATFVYCLMVLRTVRNGATDGATQSLDAFVPHLSILIAIGLALASIGVLIYYIHHIPETINVSNIAANIGRQLRKDVLEAFPDPEKLQPDQSEQACSWAELDQCTFHLEVHAETAGYVQALDQARLGEIAGNEKLLVRVQFRPGDFVVTQNTIMEAWSEKEISKETLSALEGCIAIGEHRAVHQNTLSLVDELVEIIARALSPGINDPFTAITCFNWLKVGLICFALRERHGNWPADTDPVRLYPIKFERFASAMFDQTRQYVCKDRNVALHVIGVLTEAAALVESADQQEILVAQMHKLADACTENMGDCEGAHDVRERHQEGLKILSDPDGYARYRNSDRWFGGRG